MASIKCQTNLRDFFLPSDFVGSGDEIVTNDSSGPVSKVGAPPQCKFEMAVDEISNFLAGRADTIC